MITADDFTYDLPESAIAQTPAMPRDAAKLMRVNRVSGQIDHVIFRDLATLLSNNDVLVINDSKVFPARLIGTKPSGGQVEVLLLRPTGSDTWEAMARGLKTGQKAAFGQNLKGYVVKKDIQTGHITIKLELAGKSTSSDIAAELLQAGQTPIPPYIHSPLTETDLRREYQTVYAKDAGSAAAPTAGLHFTTTLLDELERRGVAVERVTLHVGPGTFAKLRPEQIETKSLHHEWYEIKPEVADRLNQAKQAGKRIIAVGTTACRTLESAAKPQLIPGARSTDLFIMPPHQFTFVDALITNFHLPKSSLLMLVTAFCSQPNALQPFTTFKDSLMGKAYQAAIDNHYRFFSFGDAMLIE